MDAAQLQQVLESQAVFFQNMNQQNRAAMEQMVSALQREVRTSTETREKPRDKEGMTTRRAFSMLPSYNGKPEEYDTWRFQVTQFLAQDVYLPKFLDWIENEVGEEDRHCGFQGGQGA